MREIVRGDTFFSPEFRDKLRGGYYSPAHIVDIERLESGLWIPKKAVMKQWGKAPDIKDNCGSFETREEIEMVMKDLPGYRQFSL